MSGVCKNGGFYEALYGEGRESITGAKHASKKTEVEKQAKCCIGCSDCHCDCCSEFGQLYKDKTD